MNITTQIIVIRSESVDTVEILFFVIYKIFYEPKNMYKKTNIKQIECE